MSFNELLSWADVNFLYILIGFWYAIGIPLFTYTHGEKLFEDESGLEPNPIILLFMITMFVVGSTCWPLLLIYKGIARIGNRDDYKRRY